jgi:hypothetical protein
MPLTDFQIRSLMPVGKPTEFFDGNGLFLLVSASGSKLWRYKSGTPAGRS